MSPLGKKLFLAGAIMNPGLAIGMKVSHNLITKGVKTK